MKKIDNFAVNLQNMARSHKIKPSQLFTEATADLVKAKNKAKRQALKALDERNKGAGEKFATFVQLLGGAELTASALVAEAKTRDLKLCAFAKRKKLDELAAKRKAKADEIERREQALPAASIASEAFERLLSQAPKNLRDAYEKMIEARAKC